MASQLMANATTSVTHLTYESVQQAVQSIDAAIYNDSTLLDLCDLLKVTRNNALNASGLDHHSYVPSIDGQWTTSPGATYHEIGPLKKVPLPVELVERFSCHRRNSLMGVFPEIKRAWLCIDSDLFVWNYEDGSDVAYYDGLNETILCAQLIKPKEGIFYPHITHLLCVATTNNILLLGVSFVQTASGEARLGEFEEMSLLPEPLFSEPTDVFISCITATKSGRIFLGGGNGSLLEFVYQAESGWFGRKCKKVNHSQSFLSSFVPSFLSGSLNEDSLKQIVVDESRNILYTRSESGTIQVYDLEEKGVKCIFVAKMSGSDIQSRACSFGGLQRAGKLVCISPILYSESSYLHLVAVTDIGLRFYFTTTDFNHEVRTDATTQPGEVQLISQARVSLRPRFLNLVHIRVPPKFDVNQSPDQGINVTSALYSNGTLAVAYTQQQQDNERLLFVSSDNFPFTNILVESYQLQLLEGSVWSMCEVPRPPIPLPTHAKYVVGYSVNNLPAVVSQHLNIEHKFIVVNAQGTYTITKLSAVDKLQELLETAGVDSDVVKMYFDHHKVQACATCLVLICSKSLNHQQVRTAAVNAFFLHGGEADYLTSQTHRQPLGHSTPQGGAPYDPLQTPRGGTPRATLDFVSSPSDSMYSPGLVSLTGQPQLINSYKHQAIHLVISRILRPIWENRMVLEMGTMNSGSKCLASVVDSHQVVWILSKLQDVLSFLNEYIGPYLAKSESTLAPLLHQAPFGVPARGNPLMDEQTRRRNRAHAQALENATLRQVLTLTAAACEYLSLWKVLCDHQFHHIAEKLSYEDQERLTRMTFKDIVTSGRDICKELITHLVSMYVDDNAATDAISSRLRDVCPSLYANTDVILSKGSEKLQAAKSCQSNSERIKLVSEALERYKEICTGIDLSAVCNQFASARFYRGIVELSLTSAAAKDPQGLALHYYNNNMPSNDIQGAAAYAIRMDCYKMITESLDHLITASQQGPSVSLTVPARPGAPPVGGDSNTLPATDAEQQAEEVFTLALKSKDQLFHTAIYDWLISRNMAEKLLEIQSPFLEQYLKFSTSAQSGSITMWDLLWKYYEKQRNFAAAARILVSLAERKSRELRLNQRIEYLSRACICAKGSTAGFASTGDGHFLLELEEKMDVARLQLQIFEELSRMNALSDDTSDYLNSALYDITTLYNTFAEQYTMPKIKLAILHSAGHYDVALVEAVWTEIIEEELRLTENSDPAVRIQTLKFVLLAQAKLYLASESYFPIGYLVKHLEKLSCQLGLYQVNTNFVYETMLEAGVSVRKLFDVYDRLYKLKDPVWCNWRQQYHLLQPITQLLSSFIHTPTVLSTKDRNAFVISALDSISRYMNDLQAESQLDGRLQSIVRGLQAVQSSLDRMRMNITG